MFSFQKTITIGCQASDVYRYVSDPANIPQWRTDVVDVRHGALPLHEGDKMEEVVNFDGLHKYIVEVVEVIPGTKLVYKAISGSKLLPLRKLMFEQEGEHTKLTADISVHTDGFERLIQPISSNLFSIKWESYLFKLKMILEAPKKRLAGTGLFLL